MKALGCAVIVLACASPARAGHPFQVEDLHQLSRVGGARLSPDGKWVAFSVSRSDLAKNRMVTNLWMVGTAPGSVPQQMTFAEKGANGDPRFAPDSRSLYFVSDRNDGKPQVFRLPVSGGEARPVTAVPTGIDAFTLSPDGGTIAFVASVFPECSDLACSEKKEKERDAIDRKSVV